LSHYLPLARKLVCATLVALVALMGTTPANAQEFPARPLRLIVPQPPGGGFDLVGRVVASKLSELLGQQVIVENKTGAGTLVGTEAAAKAPADGYTLVVGGFSNIAANVGLYKQLPYDPVTDFVSVGMVVSYGYALVGRKDLPFRTLRELISYARQNPGKLSYASGGVGTGQHIAGAALAQATGTSLLHVPYRGAQAAYQDLLSGRVDLFFDNAGTAKQYVDTSQVKAYAVSTLERFPGLPALPTVNETGVGKVQVEAWFGIFTRAGTPAQALARLRTEVNKLSQSPDVLGRFEKGGGRMLHMSTQEAEAFVRAEVAKWSTMIREAGISAD